QFNTLSSHCQALFSTFLKKFFVHIQFKHSSFVLNILLHSLATASLSYHPFRRLSTAFLKVFLINFLSTNTGLFAVIYALYIEATEYTQRLVPKQVASFFSTTPPVMLPYKNYFKTILLLYQMNSKTAKLAL
ncbi:MAG: hypothetical protein ACI4FZ_10605, partial [Lachnospiraceae bacterium]